MYEQYWTKGRECMIWTCFSHNSAMTLTFDLETWFHVTARPSPKGTLRLKYEPIWVKRRYAPDKWSRMDRQMDGLITIGCPQREGPNYDCMVSFAYLAFLLQDCTLIAFCFYQIECDTWNGIYGVLTVIPVTRPTSISLICFLRG